MASNTGTLHMVPTSHDATNIDEIVERSMMTLERQKIKPEVAEYLAGLLEIESKYYQSPCDYLATIHCTSSTPSVTASESDPVSEIWRRKLCEWCYEVVDHFGFDREVVFIALNYLDRSVSIKTNRSGKSITRREFQLFAVTSLFMAIKVHGETDNINGIRQKLKIDAFVQLSRGFFQVDVIEKKECSILTDLDWHVNPPTTIKFIATYLRLCPKWQADVSYLCQSNVLATVYDVARYLTELSVCTSQCTFNFKTSVIGYAAVLCAIEALRSSMPLPYDVRVAFLNNVAEVTNLTPGDGEVKKASALLKELCPNLFDGDEFTSMFYSNRPSINIIPDSPIITNGGKVSPVCVTMVSQEIDVASSTRRKRSRTNSESNPGHWQSLC